MKAKKLLSAFLCLSMLLWAGEQTVMDVNRIKLPKSFLLIHTLWLFLLMGQMLTVNSLKIEIQSSRNLLIGLSVIAAIAVIGTVIILLV